MSAKQTKREFRSVKCEECPQFSHAVLTSWWTLSLKSNGKTQSLGLVTAVTLHKAAEVRLSRHGKYTQNSIIHSLSRHEKYMQSSLIHSLGMENLQQNSILCSLGMENTTRASLGPTNLSIISNRRSSVNIVWVTWSEKGTWLLETGDAKLQPKAICQQQTARLGTQYLPTKCCWKSGLGAGLSI